MSIVSSLLFSVWIFRGAEKWELLDEKVGALLPLEYKLDKLAERLEETDSKVSEIQRKLSVAGSAAAAAASAGSSSSSSSGSETPLFSEFTSRGVLSALKDIEVKVNKLAEKPNTSASTGAKNDGCDYGKRTYDIVNDVAAKVDFIVDKIVIKRVAGNSGSSIISSSSSSSSSSSKQWEDAIEDGDYSDGQDDFIDDLATSSGSDSTMSAGERDFVRLWRRMWQPVRRVNRKFDSLDKLVSSMDRLANCSVVNRVLDEDVASLLECCRANDVGVRAVARSVELLSDNFNLQMQANRCVGEVDLQTRLQQVKHEIVQMTKDVVKEAVNVSFGQVHERILQQIGSASSSGSSSSSSSSSSSKRSDRNRRERGA